ncbi:hypothetical protein CIW48_06180 [Methylobacterium sp. P1-11]|uniref:hypothetical protein n=1 Tax=Methylobacterium sp. P1-11 TaxID=2024616 RepID=UPI0011F0299B|nr:hypothetical protein [Methylobacterium sp. P1-11]KAA0124818.1 hypothetical protein CIW48_06180 [Methylobacterium sp. P1-11]
MKTLSLLAAAMIVCAAPALAQDDRSGDGCEDPQTTGALPAQLRKPAFMGPLSNRVQVTPPEESWQEQAQEGAERRRREEAEGCPVD